MGQRTKSLRSSPLRGAMHGSTKSLRDSEASGLSESTFASANDLNDEPR